MTKKFQIEKRGRRQWVLIRQAPHDPQYKLGSHIPSYGKVVAVDEMEDTDLSWLPNGGAGIIARLERLHTFCASCGLTGGTVEAANPGGICCEVNY